MYAIPFGEIFHDLIFTTGVEWLCVYCFFCLVYIRVYKKIESDTQLYTNWRLSYKKIRPVIPKTGRNDKGKFTIF